MADTNAEYILTDAEIEAIEKEWKAGETSIKDITKRVCGAKYGLRDPQGMAVRKYLSQRNGAVAPRTDADALTQTQKEFIDKHIMMRPLEIARLLFNDDKLAAFSPMFKSVRAYYDSVDSPDKSVEVQKETNDIVDTTYYSPKSFPSILRKVNDSTSANYREERMTPSQKENLNRLISYMGTNRFVHEMNILKRVSERKNFEATFIRMCYDKPDLTEEEVEMYVNYCSGCVSVDRMKAEESSLIDYKDEIMATDKTPPMTIIEAINNTRTQIDSKQKWLSKTLQELNGKRSDRLGKLASNGESVLKLIEAFRESKSREKMVQYLEFRRENRHKEVERITNMDELRAQIFGLSSEEVI
jgi:hypothetical protein